MKKFYQFFVALALVSLVLAPASAMARGGGGRSGGGGARSAPRVSAPRPSTTTTKPSTTSAGSTRPSTPRTSTRPSSTTKRVTSTTAKKVGGKTFSKRGSVVDANYQPRFRGGYNPPAGSTVYYRDNGIMDWLPFYLIMTNQSHREAVVTEPATGTAPAKETVVKDEGVDTMYIINWIVSLLLVGGIIAGIVWLVNRRTR